MKPLLVACLCLAALLVGVFASHWLVGDSTPPIAPTNGVPSADADDLRAQLAALARRLDALERAQPATAPIPERRNAQALDGAPVEAPAGAHDARWYLEQYVLSFADDAQGVEYYRLAVEAHTLELVGELATLVRDGGRPVALRIALATMLGKKRFADAPDVIDALLVAVRPPAADALALRALEALARIGSPSAAPGLEAAIALLREQNVRERALVLLVELAGDGANPALARLFARAPDDGLRRLLIRHLTGAELASALELLRAASTCEQPVRLDAARKVHEYDEPEFDAFVAQWRQVEGDNEVRAALGQPGQPGAVAGWSAKKACGPPDADRTRDDPNAWASRNADMGLQWLQLGYANAVHANGVRIFEANSPGAVAEVLARSPDGTWVSLWRGTADSGQAPLVITFPLTAFAVKTIRIIVDTNRKPGWNEIDAVELLSPAGGQWAERASASSTYASQVNEQGNQLRGDALQQQQVDAFNRAIRSQRQLGR
jgi:hypothetical protein